MQGGIEQQKRRLENTEFDETEASHKGEDELKTSARREREKLLTAVWILEFYSVFFRVAYCRGICSLSSLVSPFPIPISHSSSSTVL